MESSENGKTYNEHFGPEVIDKLRKNIHLNDIMRCLKYMSYKNVQIIWTSINGI